MAERNVRKLELALENANGNRWARDLNEAIFLAALRELFDIKKIWYPGWGEDRRLEKIFDPKELVYSDEASFLRKPEKIEFKVGRHNRVDLPDQSVDAIFFRDNHAEIGDLMNMLRILKPGGVIIKGYHCGSGNLTRPVLNGHPRLTLVDLPFSARNEVYSVFQKQYPAA
jgi:SAM-dependent methyltransferase